MTGGTLIVGASQAGLQLAASLRELGDQNPVTLIGAEARPPYQRPPLSKAFLAGKAEEDSLTLRTERYYEDADVQLRCGERVTGLRLAEDGPAGSGSATTDAGATITFDRLALTVGARPRRLEVPGADLEGVCMLRRFDDADELRRRLDRANEVVVVGGGFIGLEAAAVARAQGKAVTVVEAAPRLISRSVAPVVSEFYRHAHTRRGTEVRTGTGVAAFHGRRGRVTGVELADGTQRSADLVLVGIGAVPRTELAEQIGLVCRGGIVVDEFARTSNRAIVAAGDCTVFPEPLTGLPDVRLESVQNAVGQARVAAATLAGKPEPYTAVPWFWSDQDDLKLQIAGVTAGYDEHVVRGEPDGERFSVLYYREGRLLGIDAVNSAPDYLTVRKALSTGATIPAGRAADTQVPLKALLVDVAAATLPSGS